MAKINKVELNLGHKIANPFRTTRKSDTNPFKYSNFEGNTLQFADVFEGFEPQNVSKMKLIVSSVMGSLTKLRNSITEPIVNFVNRVKDGITSAWTYAKNTEVKIAGLDGISTKIHDIMSVDVGRGITDSISGLGKNMTDFGHGISGSWNSLIEKLSIKHIGHEKISSDLPVAELRALWEKEIELTEGQKIAKEISLNPETTKEVKVA